jgi:AcrR family transcriptional regulator
MLPLIPEFEQLGLVTRTFRRLDSDRQMAVIQAILDEAAEIGPADINVKRVAERSGVSVGSLYQYFGSREKLLAFAIQLAVRSTTEMFETYRPYLVEMPLAEALTGYLQGGIEWSQQQVGLVRFFAAAAYRGDEVSAEKIVRPIAEIMRSIIRDVLAAAVNRGELRPDLDLEAAASLANTLLIALGDAQLIPGLNVYYQAYSPELPPQRIMDALLGLINQGWAAKGRL